MTRGMRRSLIAAMVFVAACGAHEPRARPAPRARKDAVRPLPRPRPPEVVVTIVVDQLAAWIADERLPLLPKTGGFARLLGEGTYARDMRYAHAVTDTAPGHSALYTGAPPRVSQIVANETFAPDAEKPASILRDTTTHLLSAAGPQPEAGSSASALAVD